MGRTSVISVWPLSPEPLVGQGRARSFTVERVTTESDSSANENPGRDAGLRSSLPPPRFIPARQWVLDTALELDGLRRELRTEINTRAGERAGRRLDQIAHDLVLVASELATNAILHGRPPTIVELFQDEDDFLLDRGRPRREQRAAHRPAPVPRRQVVAHRHRQSDLSRARHLVRCQRRRCAVNGRRPLVQGELTFSPAARWRYIRRGATPCNSANAQKTGTPPT